MIPDILKAILSIFTFICILVLLGVLLKRIIDYIEANPLATERISKKLMILFSFAHFYFFYIRLSGTLIAFSSMATVFYVNFYSNYPHLKANDSNFLIAVSNTIISHVKLTAEFNQNLVSGLRAILCYLILWGTPMIVFFNLSANQETVSMEDKKRKISIFLGKAFEWIQNFRLHTSNNIKNRE